MRGLLFCTAEMVPLAAGSVTDAVSLCSGYDFTAFSFFDRAFTAVCLGVLVLLCLLKRWKSQLQTSPQASTSNSGEKSPVTAKYSPVGHLHAHRESIPGSTCPSS